MKLSAIFISVNLAATLPLAAQAADGVVTENSSWIKASLVSIEKTKNKPPLKLSLSDGGQPKNALRMMPFVPNRPLPKQKDMLLATQQMQPITAPYPNINQSQQPSNNPLATQVSDYAGQIYINAKRAPLNTPAGPAPRVIPGQRPSLPGQVAANQQTSPSFPVIPEPPGSPLSQLPVTTIDPYRFVTQSRGNQLSHRNDSSLVEAPSLTAEEREMMQQLLEANQARSSNNSAQPAGSNNPAHVSSAGPAPFPLNLLPQDSLKQFIGRGHDKISAPPSYFGSWHQQLKVSSLPAGGFQSHIVKHKTAVARSNQKTALSKTASAHNNQHYPNQRRTGVIASSEPEKIATYAPYPINGKTMTF